MKIYLVAERTIEGSVVSDMDSAFESYEDAVAERDILQGTKFGRYVTWEVLEMQVLPDSKTV